MWKLALLSLTLAWAAPAQADDDFEFEGIYAGSMAIDMGEATRTVPLQVSLVLTGDTVTRPDGDIVQVIDGAFLVDGEGGAFPFSNVGFDLSDSRLDMRYSRPLMDIGDDTPASFRLIGEYRGDGHIAGRVLSGNRGPIGRFDVAWTQRTTFSRTTHYHGSWQGVASMASGGEVPMSLQLVDSEGATINPADLECEYTPGKLANVRWNDLSFSISNVSIDYLRGIVTLRILGESGGSDLSIEFTIDAAGQSARGQIKSAYRGEIATFELNAP
jgi:hypothetical protein